MNAEDFKVKLDSELNNLGDKFIVLLNTNSEYFFDSVLDTVKFMTDKGHGGVFVSVVRPHSYIIKSFEKYNIETKNLFFVDTISCMAGTTGESQGRCLFIDNPNTLNEIEMGVEAQMDKIQTANKFLILDSLSTMMIYNDDKSLKRFTEILIKYLRSRNLNGIFVSVNGEINESFYDVLNTFFDKTIKI